MTSRRSPRRPISPVLIALFVGATTAGAATVLAEPPDALAGGSPGPAGSFAVSERPPVIGEAAARARPPAAPATSTKAPATTSTAPATTTEQPPPPSTTSEPAPPPSPPPAEPDDSQQQASRVVDLVNQVRAEEGCAPLTVDERLVAAALAHSTDMAARGYFEHTTPEGVKFDQRIISAGYQAPGAENIAQGQRSAQQVMDAWMKSAGHRANIVDCDLATIGVALVKDGFYWTQDFGYPLSPA